MTKKNRSDRAVKAFRDAFIDLYQTKSVENMTVEELVNSTDYSRSTFYFHFSCLDEFVRFLEQQVLDDLGPYFVSPEKPAEIRAVRKGMMPKSCIDWLNKCKKHSKFLYASLGPHGNPSFVFNLRKVLRNGFSELFAFDEMPDDAITDNVAEMLSGGVLSMLYHYFQSGSDSDFQALILAIGYVRTFRIRSKHMEKGMGMLKIEPLDEITE